MKETEKNTHIQIYLPETMFALFASGVFKADGSDTANPRLGGDENNEVRLNFVDINVFEPTLNRYRNVARTRVLQPQQNFQFDAYRTNAKLIVLFLLQNQSCSDPGTRFWLADPGYRILDTRSWLLEILATSSG